MQQSWLLEFISHTCNTTLYIIKEYTSYYTQNHYASFSPITLVITNNNYGGEKYSFVQQIYCLLV